MSKTEDTEQHLNFPIILHKEGSTSFYIPDLDYYKMDISEYLPSKLPVFFNPTMEFRRDISILAIKTYKSEKLQNITFAEPLAATGAMGIRVANELKGITVYINDISKKAIELIKKSVEYNKLDKINISNEYANNFLIECAKKIKRFDIIDIDPFGTPVPFLNSALFSIRGDGLISCTATDMPPLIGIKNNIQACIRNYGSVPLKTEYAHEIALRILIGYIVREAAKYNHAAKILLSHSSNHYIQVFVKLIHGILLANQNLTEIGYIGYCFECENRFFFKGYIPEISNKCKICGNKLKFAGPLWLGNFADKEFCQQMLKNLNDLELKTKNRIQKIIQLLIQEDNGIITYHEIPKICKKENFIIPPFENIIRSLSQEKFSVNRTHFSQSAIRTNATREKITQILKTLQPK
ncbi:MAG: tRNA (guanine(10)-N(2))-dimethyltransferase [Candidatus Helarchaeota archaeon]|nr:tRNA (guanine(10)-N(2))-dimethyltransferase [Candidatus Helarchaeota archaeon]